MILSQPKRKSNTSSGHFCKGHGIAGLKTNTIIFGWSGDQQAKENQLRTIRDLSIAGKNILLVNFNARFIANIIHFSSQQGADRRLLLDLVNKKDLESLNDPGLQFEAPVYNQVLEKAPNYISKIL